MPAPSAAEFVPAHADLALLREAAAGCRGCDLYRNATRTVFGEGRDRARIVMIGEQPGDREDREGHPFVGPAGRLLDRALDEVGIDRDTVYLTNAVKHFKFIERGKRRIHQQPNRAEVAACSAWLAAELDLVAPELVVCLGAVAAKAVLGPAVKVTEIRGRVMPPPRRPAYLDPDVPAPATDYRVLVTVHPSSILRSPDRPAAYRAFVADIARIQAHVESDRSGG
ncbi:UdgX family uracil-DNA binding protein [Nocardia brevicatena]|uniref:UdgX family uracil-DNA binding protein n=1 Tax=Nocardia brevicatena TaxID=37327 RepID=UPI00031960D6|nr:UdgX family uracil-DNA binding protein [Nocardia brevicatena]